MNTVAVQRLVFFMLLAGVTIGFFWILQPFFGAVMWAIALAILFSPMYRRLCGVLGKRRSLAALVTVLLCLVVVVLPLAAIGASLVQDVMVLSDRVKTGELSFAAYFEKIVAPSPHWLTRWMTRFGLGDITGIQQRIEGAAGQGSQRIAARALSVGQNTFEFVVSFGVMLYLLFFLLRDGTELSKIVRDTFPKVHLRTTILLRNGATQRKIAGVTGISRHTISRLSEAVRQPRRRRATARNSRRTDANCSTLATDPAARLGAEQHHVGM